MVLDANTAIRAILAGLRKGGVLNDAACMAVVDAVGEAGTDALADPRTLSKAGHLDKLAADIAADLLGPTHPTTLAAVRKSETD